MNNKQYNLQQWADMYNKADKERFNALLERDKLKNLIIEIKKMCSNNRWCRLCGEGVMYDLAYEIPNAIEKYEKDTRNKK